MDKVAIVSDALCLRHTNGPGHPERAERLRTLNASIEEAPFFDLLLSVPARDATIDEIALVHDRAYIEGIHSTAGQQHTYLDPDTAANTYTWSAARRAVGATLAAADVVMQGQTQSSFALIRPPGHHAERDRAMGFCIFNNVAIAARYVQEKYGLNRVAIVDWDVHHGNGTQNSFYDTDAVLYMSIHQYPYYPGTGSIRESGTGKGAGYTMNIPLRSGMGDDDYLRLFSDVVIPVLGEYQPELVLVSAGFDAHRDDPLAGMQLTTETFSRMTRALMAVAKAHAGSRVVCVLEGGYDLTSLSTGVAAVLAALIAGVSDDTWAHDIPSATEDVLNVEHQIAAEHARYWHCL